MRRIIFSPLFFTGLSSPTTKNYQRADLDPIVSHKAPCSNATGHNMFYGFHEDEHGIDNCC